MKASISECKVVGSGEGGVVSFKVEPEGSNWSEVMVRGSSTHEVGTGGKSREEGESVCSYKGK